MNLVKNVLARPVISALLVASSVGHAQTQDDAVARWLLNEEGVATVKLLNNISRPDTRRGVVVASPQKEGPNYYYYWIRDAALTMNTVLSLYKTSVDHVARLDYKRRLFDYATLSEENQNTWTLTGLGEPKFYVDGSGYHEPWGRPQNDGPALRAITLIGFAEVLLAEGDVPGYVTQKLYRATIPADTVIKRDLEYVAHHWRDLSFDLWEEVKGNHFYTRVAQRKAMLDGAVLARRMGDKGAAEFYEEQAKEISRILEDHYWADRGLVVETLDASYDTQRPSRMDSAVILGALHAGSEGDVYAVSGERVLSSLYLMSEKFREVYAINNRFEFTGVATGRYPEDTYSGTQDPYGNPWVLITMGYAEALYKAADAFQKLGRVPVTARTVDLYNSALAHAGSLLRLQSGTTVTVADRSYAELLRALTLEADSYVLRVKAHANPDGSLSEQMNRYTGFMTSASDLTWNYASVLTAIQARQALLDGAGSWLKQENAKASTDIFSSFKSLF